MFVFSFVAYVVHLLRVPEHKSREHIHCPNAYKCLFTYNACDRSSRDCRLTLKLFNRFSQIFSFLFLSFFTIRKTCPCNIYPLKPHFYIVKLGYAGVYLFFLFLLEKNRLWVHVRGSSNLYPHSMF